MMYSAEAGAPLSGELMSLKSSGSIKYHQSRTVHHECRDVRGKQRSCGYPPCPGESRTEQNESQRKLAQLGGVVHPQKRLRARTAGQNQPPRVERAHNQRNRPSESRGACSHRPVDDEEEHSNQQSQRNLQTDDGEQDPVRWHDLRNPSAGRCTASANLQKGENSIGVIAGLSTKLGVLRHARSRASTSSS